MKQLGEILSIEDKIEFKEIIYEAMPAIKSGYCNGCYLYENKIPCKGIRCAYNNLILKLYISPKYPVLLVAGESIEILGLKLLIKPEIHNCSGCILKKDNPILLCDRVNCTTNEVIISGEIVE